MEKLQSLDPQLVSMPSGDGEIILTPRFQGRILAAFNGKLIHKLDYHMIDEWKKGEFNNIGGNSLWPAPEGGDFAFNYPENSNAWMVQYPISEQAAEVKAAGKNIVCCKNITLENRRGRRVAMEMVREITPFAASELAGCGGVLAAGYASHEYFRFDEAQNPADFLLGAWSLEQFWLENGTVAFGKVGKSPRLAINSDFYGNPHERIRYGENFFTFTLGGENRLQIGVDKNQAPELLGAYMPESSTLLLRTVKVKPDGKYINFADNDQPDGVYSAADAFSVFNGAGLGFFELETLAPLDMADGMTNGSTLDSASLFLRGDIERLDEILREKYALSLKEIMQKGKL